MTIKRYRIDIEGLVQGVGFRPFVYRLARQQKLHGWVCNNPRGVQIEVQGDAAQLRDFLRLLDLKKPAHAEIHDLRHCHTPLGTETEFAIRESGVGQSATALVPVDLAPCAECLRELNDPGNRRHRYPFINCSHCGPRFSIIRQLPYDRANTSMAGFPLCQSCRSEYRNPADRRFHAEPIACPDCGPQLALCDATGQLLASREAALKAAAQALADGNIVALKGVGGFQLLVDATNPAAVERLRARKQRPGKPFALMYADLESLEQQCQVSPLERELLLSCRRPILLLARKQLPAANGKPLRQRPLAAAVAPDNPDLGVMLPSSPLHVLLLSGLGRPVVATSANRSGEPICIDLAEALSRLGSLADLFLTHERPIVRPLDDSVVRVMAGKPRLLRCGRGYAPLSLSLPLPPVAGKKPPDLLAVGGQLKNTIGVAHGQRVYLSQHIGDLEHRLSQQVFEQACADLTGFYAIEPAAVIHDGHPQYASTQWAQRQTQPQPQAQPQLRTPPQTQPGTGRKTAIAVQHHLAHFFAGMAEHGHRGPALGVSWDGSGWGPNDQLLGGEFWHWDGAKNIRHVASLKPFPLPGGERAIREPRRQAVGLLYAMQAEHAFTRAPQLWRSFTPTEQHNLTRMLVRRLNTPWCSSVGRLFDGVAALLNLATHNRFEGEAAMALEFSARSSTHSGYLPFAIRPAPDTAQQPCHWLIDWQPMVSALLEQRAADVPRADLAAAFHNSLVEIIVTISQLVEDCPVFLSGGVFQNRRLTESVTERLGQLQRPVYSHQRVPPNDGGLALGQLYYVRAMEE